MKKLLKIEVDQRKDAETYFKEEINTKANKILAKFTSEYLDKLKQMQEQVE